METAKSFDECEVIVALVHDVLKSCAGISPRAIRLTQQKLRHRVASEGLSFLTKALPRLGKALDRALLGREPLNCIGFRKIPNTQLPRFLGELFQQVFGPDGKLLPQPHAKSIASLRDVLYLFYKYELPYSKETENEVLRSFIKTDGELAVYNGPCANSSGCGKSHDLRGGTSVPGVRYRSCGCDYGFCARTAHELGFDIHKVIRRAQLLLERVFQSFDWRNIYPKHGPGAVSTKERLWDKYKWSRVSERLIAHYPLDEFFFVSLTDVCDNLSYLNSIEIGEDAARVVLVPKDSRGPRLISEEPLVFQWIQQGLRRALYDHIERHELTAHAVHFTDQRPNQLGALLGSMSTHYWVGADGQRKSAKLQNGRYATLDLKEASDRVSVGLVRLLYPEHISEVLMGCRSLGTILPSGEYVQLNKYAPMGSALCFPVMALTIWAILRGGGLDEESRGEILVYGDDVIVPTAQAEDAIKLLELFGLKVNRDKSCFHGFFRESCGVDAYDGVNVTPIRIRKVWTSTRCPDTLESWSATERSMYSRGYRTVSELIAKELRRVYGVIPYVEHGREKGEKPLFPRLPCPTLCTYTEEEPPRRFNRDTQQWEYRVWTTVPRKTSRTLDGWKMLLRYFTEKGPSTIDEPTDLPRLLDAFVAFGDSRVRSVLEQKRTLDSWGVEQIIRPYESSQVSMYTRRRSNKLIRKWVTEMPLASRSATIN